MSNEYISVMKHDNLSLVSVVFFIESEPVFSIGEEMNKANECAYMNGYNWEMLLDYYFTKNHPALFEGIQPDPEAGMYSASFELNDANVKKAESICEIVTKLVENKQILLDLVVNFGDEIEWD